MSRRQQGFSLAELLVVIGIIALLIAILLPVLSRARAEAQRVKCMSNLRTIQQAIVAYTSDSKGRLPAPNWADSVFSRQSYPFGWLYEQGVPKPPLGPDHVKSGILFQYLKQTAVFHCPQHGYENTSVDQTQRLTSYLMNGAVCGYGKLGVGQGRGAGPPTYRITAFTRPAEKVIMWEGNEGRKSEELWRSGSDYPLANGMTARHGKGGMVAMFDGHVEWWSADDYKTESAKPGPNRLYCAPFSPGGGH